MFIGILQQHCAIHQGQVANLYHTCFLFAWQAESSHKSPNYFLYYFVSPGFIFKLPERPVCFTRILRIELSGFCAKEK